MRSADFAHWGDPRASRAPSSPRACTSSCGTPTPSDRSPVAGTVAGLFNLVALFAVGAAGRLLQPGGPVAFVGGWIMVVALVVASVAGAIAVWLGDRR